MGGIFSVQISLFLYRQRLNLGNDTLLKVVPGGHQLMCQCDFPKMVKAKSENMDNAYIRRFPGFNQGMS